MVFLLVVSPDDFRHSLLNATDPSRNYLPGARKFSSHHNRADGNAVGSGSGESSMLLKPHRLSRYPCAGADAHPGGLRLVPIGGIIAVIARTDWSGAERHSRCISFRCVNGHPIALLTVCGSVAQ